MSADFLRSLANKLRDIPLRHLNGITGLDMDRLDELANQQASPDLLRATIKNEVVKNLSLMMTRPDGMKCRVTLRWEDEDSGAVNIDHVDIP